MLGGAVRGDEARERLLERTLIDTFIAEGVGCSCVRDAPWYTVAESCELALDACDLTSRAREIYSWMSCYRMKDGSY